jgi:hypothetical protein
MRRQCRLPAELEKEQSKMFVNEKPTDRRRVPSEKQRGVHQRITWGGVLIHKTYLVSRIVIEIKESSSSMKMVKIKEKLSDQSDVINRTCPYYTVRNSGEESYEK